MDRLLLTTAEAAERLNVSRRWMADQVRLGLVPVVRLGPKLVRLAAGDLDALIAARRVEPTPPPTAAHVRAITSQPRATKRARP